MSREPVASMGLDWPTAELQGILDEYGLRIIQRDRRRTGTAPWRASLSTGGGQAYDPQATWTETHYTIRRSVICEACGQLFGYSFEVDQISRVHQEGRSTDGSLRRELSRQLRRRLRCSHCGVVQKEPRRALKRQDRIQSGLSCGLVAAGVILVGGLGLLGALLAGTVGFAVGLLTGLLASLVLWYYAFAYILGARPTV